MEDEVGMIGDERLRCIHQRKIDCERSHASRKTLRHRGRHNVDERELRDLLATNCAVLRQPLGKLAADHACGSDDEDVHQRNSAEGSSKMDARNRERAERHLRSISGLELIKEVRGRGSGYEVLGIEKGNRPGWCGKYHIERLRRQIPNPQFATVLALRADALNLGWA